MYLADQPKQSHSSTTDDAAINFRKHQYSWRMDTMDTTPSSVDAPMGDAPHDTPASEETSQPSSIPQKRVLEDDHVPSVSSPLNPDFNKVPKDEAPAAKERAARAKKESFKKREAKGPAATEARDSPDPAGPAKQRKTSDVLAPLRYKLAPPRLADFEPPQGPVFTPSHTIKGPDGAPIQFYEASD